MGTMYNKSFTISERIVKNIGISVYAQTGKLYL